MRYLFFLFLLSSATPLWAQGGATDCPDFSAKPNKKQRGDFMEYLRKSQSGQLDEADEEKYSPQKKTVAIAPATENNASATSAEQRKLITPTPTPRYRVVAKGEAQQAPPEKPAETEKINTPKPISKPAEEPEITSATPASAIKTETKPIATSNETTDEKGEGVAQHSEKHKTNSLNRKLQRLFTRKHNKPHKPNYKRCATQF